MLKSKPILIRGVWRRRSPWLFGASPLFRWRLGGGKSVEWSAITAPSATSVPHPSPEIGDGVVSVDCRPRDGGDPDRYPAQKHL